MAGMDPTNPRLIRVFLILPAADKNLATHTFRGRRLDMSSLVRLCWAV